METNEERRTRRLRSLCDREGGLVKVAERAGLNPASLDQILKGVPLPQKKDGTVSPRSLGSDAARSIELAFDLGRGWFDWPLDGVDYKAYWSLDDIGRGIAQERMMQAVRERRPLSPEEDAAEAEAGRRALLKHKPQPIGVPQSTPVVTRRPRRN